MAENSEQRTIEIVLKGQQANASLNEMAAAARVMSAQLSKMGQDDPGREKLLNDLQLLNQRLQEQRAQMRQGQKSAEELAEAELAAAEATEALAAANEQTVATGKKATASLNEMKAAAALVEKQLADMSQDDPGRDQLQRDFTQLNQRITATTATMRTHIKTEAELAEEQRKATEALEKLNRENVQVVINGKKVTANFNEIEAAVSLLEKELKLLPAGMDAFIKKSKELKEMKDRMNEVSKEMAGTQGNALLAALGIDGVTSASGLLKVAFQSAVAAMIPLLAVQQLWELVKGFVGMTQEVNEVRAAITGATGEQGAMLDTLTARVRALSKTFGDDYADQLKAADVLAKQMGISHEQAFDLMEKGYLAGANRSGEFLDNIKEYSVQFKAAGFSAEEFITHISQAELGGVFSDKGADVVKEFGLRIREQTTATTDAMDAAFGRNFTDRIFKGINDGSMTVKTALMEVSQAMNNTAIPASKLQTVVADVFGGPGEDAGTKFLQSLSKAQTGIDSLIDKTNEYTRLQAEELDLNKWLATEEEKMAVHFAGSTTSLSNVWTAFKARLYADINNIVEGIQKLGWVAEGSIAALKAWARDFVTVFGAIAHRDWGAAKQALQSMGRDGGEAYSKAYHTAMERSRNAEEAAAEARKKEAKAKEEAAAAQAAKEKFEGEEKTRKELEAQRKKDAAAAEAARKKHLAEMKKLQEQAVKDQLEAEKSLEDLRVALLLDKNEREIAEINLQTSRKMAALKGSDEQIQEQWELLEQERQDKINAVRQRQRDEEEAQKVADQQAQQDKIAAEEELYLANLEDKVARGLESEQFYQDQLYEIKKAALERELELPVEKGEGETAEAKRVQAALLRGTTAHIAGEKKQKEDLAKFERMLAANGAALLTDSLGFLVDNLNKQSSAYEAFKVLLKAAQIAEIGINLQGELSDIAAAAAKNKLNSVTYGGAGAAQYAFQSAIAIGRAALGAAKVAAFAEGGPTDRPTTMLPLDLMANLLSGRSGGSQARMGSFAGGGPVEQARIGLIGEAGPELVIPNWLYADPKQANLMGFLEQAIASRGGAFAAGGSTTGTSPVGSTSSMAEAGGDVLGLLERIARSNEDFRAEISEWQRNLAVNMDYRQLRDGLDVVDQVRSGGGLKRSK